MWQTNWKYKENSEDKDPSSTKYFNQDYFAYSEVQIVLLNVSLCTGKPQGLYPDSFCNTSKSVLKWNFTFKSKENNNH